MIRFWMILSMLVNHPKLDVIYFWVIHSMRKSSSESRCLKSSEVNDDIIAREQSNNKRIHYKCKACRLSPNFFVHVLES